ncbi:MAG: helix-turn-helix domain-containing protein [Geminicoccaceae bacterium]
MKEPGLSTVGKASSMLDLFSESRASIGLFEVSILLQRDKTTVQRHLAAPSERGFLEQNARY